MPSATIQAQIDKVYAIQRHNEFGPERNAFLFLPGNYSGQIQVVDAKMVGNYAIKIEWSDEHDTGIYSFEYLRELCPPK